MKQRRTRLDQAAMMPPLKHSSAQGFDWAESEVWTWLASQDKVRQFVFDTCRHSGLIVHNAATGTWRGKDYKPDTGAERYRF